GYFFSVFSAECIAASNRPGLREPHRYHEGDRCDAKCNLMRSLFDRADRTDENTGNGKSACFHGKLQAARDADMQQFSHRGRPKMPLPPAYGYIFSKCHVPDHDDSQDDKYEAAGD